MGLGHSTHKTGHILQSFNGVLPNATNLDRINTETLMLIIIEKKIKILLFQLIVMVILCKNYVVILNGLIR